MIVKILSIFIRIELPDTQNLSSNFKSQVQGYPITVYIYREALRIPGCWAPRYQHN